MHLSFIPGKALSRKYCGRLFFFLRIVKEKRTHRVNTSLYIIGMRIYKLLSCLVNCSRCFLLMGLQGQVYFPPINKRRTSCLFLPVCFSINQSFCFSSLIIQGFMFTCSSLQSPCPPVLNT